MRKVITIALAAAALVSAASLMSSPASAAPADQAAAVEYDEIWNAAFPDPQLLGHYPPGLARAIEPCQQPGDLARISRPVDWFGLNHYSPLYVRADPAQREAPCARCMAKLTPDIGRYRRMGASASQCDEYRSPHTPRPCN